MGRAQANSPASSDVPAKDAAPAADDLLAQLAAEDIDRMLAEAEVETTPAPVATAPGEPVADDASKSASIPDDQVVDTESVSSELEELLAKEEAAQAGSPPASAAASLNESAVAPATSEPLEDSASVSDPSIPSPGSGQASEGLAPQAAVSAPAVPTEGLAAAPRKSDGTSTATSTESPDSPSHTSAQAAIPAAAATSSPPKEASTDATTHDASSAGEDETPIPIYIRVLEFINSPLDSLPDPIREIVGKIALVTFINAVVVIGYVLLFRRK
jgi:hypothetical protein